MIYLLVQDSQGYDDCDRPLFANSDLVEVRAVRSRLVRKHKRLHPLACKLQAELENIYRMHPVTDARDVGENIALVRRLSDEAILKFQKKYRITDQDATGILDHTRPITYSIDEIEDDPDKI